uniref:Helicase ATP-binding domain-containing protein n=1 Tax=Echeneis naucrates TaxID=173247 RepID=A0A665U2Z7_ECHNA
MIADEMGLGKMVQAIAVAYTFRKEWPLLVVLTSSWIEWLQPGDDNLEENKNHTISRKVTVLSYGLLTTGSHTLLDFLIKQNFPVVVVDESHYLKSRNMIPTKILSAKQAILLTGTLALGRPGEVTRNIEALYMENFWTWTQYSKTFCNAHFSFFGSRRQGNCCGASNLRELHQRLSQIMICRLQAEALSQLLPKIRQCIPFDLPKEAAKVTIRRCFMSAADATSVEIMKLVSKMYKQTAIAKAGAVKDYIKMMLETEQLKFLVFAHHRIMLQASMKLVTSISMGNILPSLRIQLVQFQSDPETRVVSLSVRAAGQVFMQILFYFIFLYFLSFSNHREQNLQFK